MLGRRAVAVAKGNNKIAAALLELDKRQAVIGKIIGHEKEPPAL
jgi:hypothetical protein